MRRPNQATKQLIGLPRDDQFAVTLHGGQWLERRQALNLTMSWKLWLSVHESTVPKNRAELKMLKIGKAVLVENLVAAMEQAIRSGNGQFFKDIAAVLDGVNKIEDPIRLWFLLYFQTKSGLDFFTLPQPYRSSVTIDTLRNDFEQDHEAIDDAQLRDYAGSIGVQLADAKRGPKAGPRMQH